MAKVIFGLSSQPTTAQGAARNTSITATSPSSSSVASTNASLSLDCAKDDGAVEPDADDEARHKSGSYYTPDELVSLIIAHAVGAANPGTCRRIHGAGRGTRLRRDRRTITERLSELAAHDPASRSYR